MIILIFNYYVNYMIVYHLFISDLDFTFLSLENALITYEMYREDYTPLKLVKKEYKQKKLVNSFILLEDKNYNF